MQKWIVEGGLKKETPATVVLAEIKAGGFELIAYTHAAGDTTTPRYTAPSLMFNTEAEANARRDAMNAKLGV